MRLIDKGLVKEMQIREAIIREMANLNLLLIKKSNGFIYSRHADIMREKQKKHEEKQE